jgi:CHAT domain-containing protein
VHIICHGRFSVERATLSGLQMSDGVFTCEEIAQMNLPDSPQVILSACKGLLSDPNSHFHTHVSPAGAFLHAGADAVIAAISAVSDYLTCILMLKTYDLLEEGAAGIQRAFRLAQRWLRTATISDVRKFNVSREGGESPVLRPFDESAYWGTFVRFGP